MPTPVDCLRTSVWYVVKGEIKVQMQITLRTDLQRVGRKALPVRGVKIKGNIQTCERAHVELRPPLISRIRAH